MDEVSVSDKMTVWCRFLLLQEMEKQITRQTTFEFQIKVADCGATTVG